MDPRIYVDFNEMCAENEVLLSMTDNKLDSAGNVVDFFEGKHVHVYMDDEDVYGNPDNLIADGIAVRNTYGEWTSAAKWILKINNQGIRHASESSKQ